MIGVSKYEISSAGSAGVPEAAVGPVWIDLCSQAGDMHQPGALPEVPSPNHDHSLFSCGHCKLCRALRNLHSRDHKRAWSSHLPAAAPASMWRLTMRAWTSPAAAVSRMTGGRAELPSWWRPSPLACEHPHPFTSTLVPTATHYGLR